MSVHISDKCLARLSKHDPNGVHAPIVAQLAREVIELRRAVKSSRAALAAAIRDCRGEP